MTVNQRLVPIVEFEALVLVCSKGLVNFEQWQNKIKVSFGLELVELLDLDFE